MARVKPRSRFSIDWLPDGWRLVVSARSPGCWREELDGLLVTQADLTEVLK